MDGNEDKVTLRGNTAAFRPITKVTPPNVVMYGVICTGAPNEVANLQEKWASSSGVKKQGGICIVKH